MEKDRGDDRSRTGGEPHRKGRLPLGTRIPSGRLLHGDIFPQKNVRFIAVNDGVDSTVESSNDFNPIRNWANELHAKDTSRKVRAVMKMKAEQGERLGGRPPYGYRKSDGDTNTLVPDEDTAPVVKHIFSSAPLETAPSGSPPSSPRSRW